MLLAAGIGERMRPLTLTTPKPLLEVQGEALIDRQLLRLRAAGVDEVVVNVSWLGERIVAHCGDGSRYRLRLHYSREATPLETAGGIVQALPLLGDAPFLVANADTYTDYPYADIVAAAGALAPRAGHLVLVPNPQHNAGGDFSLHDGRVERPQQRTLTFAGIAAYHPQFFAGLAVKKAPLLPLLLRAIDDGRLSGERFDGAWTDVGTPERLQALNASSRG
jgi:MurNAc alpha-1-phosphate uridylyltransferase